MTVEKLSYKRLVCLVALFVVKDIKRFMDNCACTLYMT